MAQDFDTTRGSAELSPGEVVPGSRYSSVEVDRGLVALALCDGSSRCAETLLADQGERISESTLRRWREEQYPDRYLELRAKAMPRLNALAADRHAELATRAGDLNARMLDRLEEVYSDIDPRDLPGAVRNVATVAGIHEDKRAQREGEATGPHMPSRSVADILSALDGKGISVKLDIVPSDQGENTEPAIEGTASESSPQPPSPQSP